MNEELSGCLGYVQRILEELIDCGQGFLVKIIWALATEYFLDKHLAQRNRKLIDQSTDTKFTICNNISFCEEYLTNIQCHLGFLVGAADFLDLLYIGTIRDMYILNAFLIQTFFNCSGIFINITICLVICDFLHYNNVILIYCCDEVFSILSEVLSDFLQNIGILSIWRFYDKNCAFYISLNMQFLGTAVNIYQKQIIQKEDKVVLIKSLFVCDHQVLKLECCHLTYHICILACIIGNQYVFQLLVIINLKELTPLYLLAVCRRLHELQN